MVFRIKCKWCGNLITFDGAQRSKNGKSIPLNLDGTFHECPSKPEAIPNANAEATDDSVEKLDSILRSVGEINNLLHKLQGKLCATASEHEGHEESGEVGDANGKKTRKTTVAT